MKIRFSHRFALIAILGMLSIWGALGERTPFNNGLGWDGKNYALLTSNFEYMALHQQIDSYQYQRILSPVVVFYTCKMLKIELSVENIPHVFRVFNLLLIASSIWFFFKLCSHFKLKPQSEIIGFSALYFNYFILKNTPYYPILTDISGFWIGMVICYFFFTQQKTALICTALIAQFTFPLVLLTSMPLCFNIRHNALLTRMQSANIFQPLVVFTMAMVLALIGTVIFLPSVLDPKYTMVLNLYVLPVSILWVMLYIWKVMIAFNTPEMTVGHIHYYKILLTTFGIIGFIILSNNLIATISIPEDGFTPQVFIFNIIQQSVSLPFISIIAHTIYIGPAMVLIMLFFKPFTRVIKQQGDSAVAYFIVIALLCLGSESRQFVPYFPFLVVILMLTVNNYVFTTKQATLFVLLSLVYSKFWFSINVPGIYSQYAFGHFPDQRYFMNHGPFMSQWSYLINVFCTGLIAVCVYGLFRNTASSHTNLTDSSVPSR